MECVGQWQDQQRRSGRPTRCLTDACFAGACPDQYTRNHSYHCSVGHTQSDTVAIAHGDSDKHQHRRAFSHTNSYENRCAVGYSFDHSFNHANEGARQPNSQANTDSFWRPILIQD